MHVSAQRAVQVRRSNCALWRVARTSASSPSISQQQVGSGSVRAAVSGSVEATQAPSERDAAQRETLSAQWTMRSVEQPKVTPRPLVQCHDRRCVVCPRRPISVAGGRCTMARASRVHCSVWIREHQERQKWEKERGAARTAAEIAVETHEKQQQGMARHCVVAMATVKAMLQAQPQRPWLPQQAQATTRRPWRSRGASAACSAAVLA